jgi:hypothetical protein
VIKGWDTGVATMKIGNHSLTALSYVALRDPACATVLAIPPRADAALDSGEKCVLTCKSEYAYGARGSPPKIPADATLQFEVPTLQPLSSGSGREARQSSSPPPCCEVELLDFEIPKWKLTVEQKIEKVPTW